MGLVFHKRCSRIITSLHVNKFSDWIYSHTAVRHNDGRNYSCVWIQKLMSKPLIQIDDEIREMTDEEYQALLDSGWTADAPDTNPTSDPA